MDGLIAVLAKQVVDGYMDEIRMQAQDAGATKEARRNPLPLDAHERRFCAIAVAKVHLCVGSPFQAPAPERSWP